MYGIWWWDDIIFTVDQVNTFFDSAFGVQDLKSSPVTSSTSGPTFCWVDGELEVFAEDTPRMGCEIAPGMTGAPGQTDAGYYMEASHTVENLSSMDLSTNWTDNGTGTVTCPAVPATSPFRSAHSTRFLACNLVDDDAAAVESISQTVADASLNTNDNITVCLYAATDAGTDSLDISIDEATGTCTPSTTNFSSVTVDTDWTVFKFEHSVQDGGCTDFTYNITPTSDITNAALTTTNDVYVLVNVYHDINAGYCPTYNETVNSAVSYGDDYLEYDLSGSKVAVSGALVDRNTITSRASFHTPGSSLSSSLNIWSLNNNSCSDRFETSKGGGSDVILSVFDSGGSGSLTGSGVTVAAGDTVDWLTTHNWDDDLYTALYTFTGGTDNPGDDTTAATSPTIAELSFGRACGTTSAQYEQLSIRDFTIVRDKP